MNVERLGRRIRELREARGMSSPELARRARIDRSDLWRIEHGRGPRSIGFDRLERIANALGVPLAALLENPRKPPRGRRGRSD
jgi:transcriptional regulator with XRE-family HTH domain